MTIVDQAPPASVETILKDSWKLLRRNWSLVVPMLLSGFAFAAAIALAAVAIGASGFFAKGTPSDRAIATIFLAYAVLLVAGFFVSAIVVDATFGMADAAWSTGRGTFAAGRAAVRARFVPTLVAFVGYAVAVFCTVVLAIPTLGIVFIAFPLITMYVMPAVVAGGAGGFGAFGESWRLVRRYFGPSAIAMLILYAVQYLITTVFSFAIFPIEFGFIAAIGDGKKTPSFAALGGLGVLLLIVVVVMMVVLVAYQAYFTLAITGVYRWLRERAATEDAAAVAAPGYVVPAPAAPAPLPGDTPPI